MKKNIIVVFALALAATLVGCEKTIQLDLKQTASKVIIEGLITNQSGYQYVKVTRSTDFYSTVQSPRITNATVVVTDDANNTYTFVHNPEHKEGHDGIYLPETPFNGVIGRTYSLSVLVDGQSYEAHDKLFAVTTIDSIGFKIDEEEKKDPKKKGKYYRSLMYAKEPKTSVDFYLFKFYRNDTLVFDNETDIAISDDANIAENIDGVEGDGHYGVGDTAKMQIYSLSRDAYVYYNDLSILLQNSGGIFGSPPANSRTNLSNGALGFFQVSALNYKEAILKD